MGGSITWRKVGHLLAGGSKQIQLALRKHGRSIPGQGQYPTTVGWFAHDQQLSIKVGTDPQTKAELKRPLQEVPADPNPGSSPNKKSPSSSKVAPIRFNYQPSSLTSNQKDSSFRLQKSPNQERDYQIELILREAQPSNKLEIRYNQNHQTEAQIQELANIWLEQS